MQNKAPIVWMVVPLMVGIGVGEWWPQLLSVKGLLILLGVGLVMLAFFVAAAPKWRIFRSFFNPALLFTMVVLGCLLMRLSDPLQHNSHYAYYIEAQSSTRFEVRLLDTPQPTAKSYKAPAEVLRVADSQGWHPTTGRIMLFFHRDSVDEQLQYGDKLHVLGRPAVPFTLDSLHDFDYRKYLRHKGIHYTCYLTPDRYQVVAHQSGGLIGWSKQVQRQLLSRLQQRQLPSSQQGIAEALLLGWKSDIDGDVQQHFRAAGLAHLLCVSGLHVGIVAALIGGLFFFLGRRLWQRIVRGILQLLGVWTFVLITGMAPATLRAGIMFTLFIISDVAARRVSSYNILATSAFIMLCCNPHLLFDVGFQLSYTAVLGIVYLYRPLCSLIRFSNRRWVVVERLWKLACLSTAAQLGTLPVSLYVFHQFPLYFLLANMVVVPFAGLLLALLLLTVFSSGWVWLCGLFTRLLAWVLGAVDSFTQWVSQLPHALISDIPFTLPMALLCALAIFCLGQLLRVNPFRCSEI